MKLSLLDSLEDVPCDLCGVKDDEFLYSKPGNLTGHPFRLVRCRRCGLLYLNPRLSEAGITQLYDPAYYEGKGFDAHYTGNDPLAKEHFEPSLILQVLRDQIPHRSQMLDFGCGAGRLLQQAKAGGFGVEGYEFSSAAAERSRAKGFQVYRRAEDIPTGRYDVVTAVEVLEHCASPLQAIRTIYRALKPGGLFFYTTENFDGFYTRWKLGQTPPQDGYVVPEGHIYFFSTPVMQAYFQKVGFRRTVRLESPAYVKHSRAYRLLSKLGMVNDQNAPVTPLQKLSYFTSRRVLNALGCRGFLPLAFK